MTEEQVKPGKYVLVTSNQFKGQKLAIVLRRCKSGDGWIVELVSPDSVTKSFCIFDDRDTIILAPKRS